jgi:DNA-binding transcriptional MerR regulator
MTTTKMPTDEITYSTQDVINATPGLTYRVLDYWLRTGVIVLVSNPKTGSGGRRRFTETEVMAVKRLFERYQATVRDLEFIRSGGAWMQEALLAS